MKELKVTGAIDVEIDGSVLTILGGTGTVAVSTIEADGAKLYVYHPGTGWKEYMDMTEPVENASRNVH